MNKDLMDKFCEDAAKKRLEILEAYAAAYMRETGLKASELELVEKGDGPRIVWYFRRKGSDE